MTTTVGGARLTKPMIIGKSGGITAKTMALTGTAPTILDKAIRTKLCRRQWSGNDNSSEVCLYYGDDFTFRGVGSTTV